MWDKLHSHLAAQNVMSGPVGRSHTLVNHHLVNTYITEDKSTKYRN